MHHINTLRGDRAMEILSNSQIDELKSILKNRFLENMNRHSSANWDEIWNKISTDNNKLWSLHLMEDTDGEPDVIEFSIGYAFVDFSRESPIGRRSLCYDEDALHARKANKPAGSAVHTAEKMGVQLLDEEQYRYLQEFGEFDLKTSTWIKTPPEIRALGGALFCDRRYDHVFTYHNGADSYYASRGFRTILWI